MYSQKEYIYNSIAHKGGYCLPYNFMFVPPAQSKLENYYQTDDLNRALGLFMCFIGCNDKPLYASPKMYGEAIADQFGVVWTNSEIDRGSPIDYPLKEPKLDGYVFPDPNKSDRYEGLKEQADKYNDLFLVGVIGDLWERAGFMRGQEGLLYDVVLHPEFLDELLDEIMEYNLVTMRNLSKRIKFDCMFLSDDYGTQKDLMISPESWRRFIKPRLVTIFGEVRKKGLKTMLHSCGNIEKIIPDLIEIGLDILHPVQPEAMDIFKLKKEYGRDLTFQGGISTQNILPYGTPQQVIDETRKTAELMGLGGGYILEPGITLQADVPLDNLVALIETARSL